MPGVRTLDQSGAGSANTDLASGSNLILLAPLDGWVSPLGEVPDPVFADKMMGDGLAIDPTGSVLCAPCDGEVILLHAALHAITLRAANGAEILMHIGLDTVALGGEGFTPHVTPGPEGPGGREADLVRSRPVGASRPQPDHADHHHQWRGFRHRAAVGESRRRVRTGADDLAPPDAAVRDRRRRRRVKSAAN